jgi:hypothetical protein
MNIITFVTGNPAKAEQLAWRFLHIYARPFFCYIGSKLF